MNTLKERLIFSMGADITQADLARECKVSRAAVTKWFNEKTKKIDAVHIFTIARRCNVDPEWLATGKEKPDRGVAQSRADTKDILPRRLDLIRRYGDLPDDIRMPIRMLIENLTPPDSSSYTLYLRKMEEFNEVRDAKPGKRKKTTTG